MAQPAESEGEKIEEEITEKLEKLPVNTEEHADEGEEDDDDEDEDDEEEGIMEDGAAVTEEDAGNVEDDDEGWITPSNIKKIKEAKKAAETPLPIAKVACITTDFAMQNVLLQMRLRVISFDGLAIRTAKTWVLRCHACFK